jgi:hypothetical protein
MSRLKPPFFDPDAKAAIKSLLAVVVASLIIVLLVGRPSKSETQQTDSPLEQFDIPLYILSSDSFVLLPEPGESGSKKIGFFEVGETFPTRIPIDTILTLDRRPEDTQWQIGVRGLGNSFTISVKSATDSIVADIVPQGTLISLNPSPKKAASAQRVLAVQYNRNTGRVLNLLVLQEGNPPTDRAIQFPKNPALLIRDSGGMDQVAELLARDGLWSNALGLQKKLSRARKKWSKKTDISEPELSQIKQLTEQLRTLLSALGDTRSLAEPLSAYIDLAEQIARDRSIRIDEWRSFSRMLVILRQLQLEKAIASAASEVGVNALRTESVPVPASMALNANTATRNVTPVFTVTNPPSTPQPTPTYTPTKTPSAQATRTPTSTPTSTPTPTPTTSSTPCPDYGLMVSSSDEPNEKSEYRVVFSWHSVYGTNDFLLSLRDSITGRIFPAIQVFLPYFEMELPAGTYLAQVSERERLPQGKYIKQCFDDSFEIARQCRAFKEPTVEKVNRNGEAEFAFQFLKSASALWHEIVHIKPGKAIPPLTEADAGFFTTAARKACYMWQRGFDPEYREIFSGLIKKVPGRFTTDDRLAETTDSAIGASHLVCTYLCPTCNPQLAVEGFADSFIRGWTWSGEKQVTPGDLKPLSPMPGATIYSAFPTFFWQGADAEGKSSPSYSFILRKEMWGKIVAAAPRLTLPLYRHDKPLAPGAYTFWLKLDLPSSGTPPKWGPPISFKVEIGAPVLFSPASGIELNTLIPRFEWARSKNPKARFEIQIDDLSAKRSFLNEKYLQSTSYVLKNQLLYGHEYSWKVRENKGGQAGAWSTLRKFKAPGDQMALIFPQSAISAKSPFFSWKKVPGAKYEIWLEYLNPKQKIISIVTPSTGLSLEKPVQIGRSIRVWMRTWVEENGKYNPRSWQPPVDFKVSK